jgi:phospholipid/cholesterol/gamma-HCH transport system substrate-binding protein
MKSMKNIESFTSNLSKNDSLLTTVTGDEKSTQSLIQTLHNVKEITKELQEIGKNINKVSSSLDSSILAPTSSTIKEIELIMRDVKSKLEALNGLVNAVGSYDKDVLMLKEQISVGMEKTNQIMDKIDSLMQQNQSPEVRLP